MTTSPANVSVQSPTTRYGTSAHHCSCLSSTPARQSVMALTCARKKQPVAGENTEHDASCVLPADALAYTHLVRLGGFDGDQDVTRP